MPLYSNEIARKDGTGVQVRAEPVRARWRLEDLAAADGHALRVGFACSVRALPDEAEKRMLEEVFLNANPAVRVDDVVEHFRSSLRPALAATCQKRPAGEWVDGDKAELVDALKAAGKKVAFACGLELLPPFEVEVDSPTLERQRLEAMQRSLAEQRAAGQMEHFQRATELLKQFEMVRQSAPHLSAGEVLKQISPADQGMVLQTLLMAAAKQKTTEAIWAVAGPSLVKVDTKNLVAQSVALPGDLGPLRSVTHGRGEGEGKLLVGARAGVMVVDPSQPGQVQTYLDPGVTSQLGFSRAMMWHSEIWGCHGEAGVVVWKIGEVDQPMRAMRPADLGGSGARNLHALDEMRAIVSVGSRLLLLERGEQEGRPTIDVKVIGDLGAEIVAILPQSERVTVVMKNGRMQARDARTLEMLRDQRPCGEVVTAAMLPWLGSARVLLASEHGPVMCVGWEDDLVTQYQSSYSGIKALAASADVVAGLSGDRQRIVVWNSWHGREPAGEVFVPAIARHRAADVEV